MKELSHEELYFKETGEKVTYRKGSSDYHTLHYVRWLESRLNRLAEVEKLLVAVYEEWKDAENIKTPEMDGFELLNKIKDWVQEASHDTRTNRHVKTSQSSH